jgi:hypothetical protein
MLIYTIMICLLSLNPLKVMKNFKPTISHMKIHMIILVAKKFNFMIITKTIGF